MDNEACAALSSHAVEHPYGHAVTLRESHHPFRLEELVYSTKTMHARVEDLAFATQPWTSVNTI